MEFLYKHAKNFIAGKDTYWPALQGIYFDGKSAIMSDGYVSFMIKNYPSLKRVVEPKTGRDIPVDYPNVMQAMPKKFIAEISFAQYLSSWIKVVKIGADIVKGENTTNAVRLHFNGDKLTLYAQNISSHISMQGLLPFDKSSAQTSIDGTFNAKYLLHTLNAFKDLGSAALQFKFAQNMAVLESGQALALIGGVKEDALKRRHENVTA